MTLLEYHQIGDQSVFIVLSTSSSTLSLYFTTFQLLYDNGHGSSSHLKKLFMAERKTQNLNLLLFAQPWSFKFPKNQT
jgi:hypothetical protein